MTVVIRAAQASVLSGATFAVVLVESLIDALVENFLWGI